MDSELRALYQEVILDHSRSPRNHFILDPFDCEAHGYNPLCGDDIRVYARLGDNTRNMIKTISFTGHGCAISQASASMMCEVLSTCSRDYFESLFAWFRAMCLGEEHTEPISQETRWQDDTERLHVFSGVREFPSRVKCATLAWHALHAALQGKAETRTE